MKDLYDIQAAWEISIAMDRLNNLIWDRYEDDFIELYIKRYPKILEEMLQEKYQGEPRF